MEESGFKLRPIWFQSMGPLFHHPDTSSSHLCGKQSFLVLCQAESAVKSEKVAGKWEGRMLSLACSHLPTFFLFSFLSSSFLPFSLLFTFFLFFQLCCMASETLVPWVGLESVPPLLGAWSPNLWATSEVTPSILIIRDNFFSDHFLVLGALYIFKLLRVLKSFTFPLGHVCGYLLF